VAENVYTKVLRQAAEIQGSTQALATLLHAPEHTLLRWMSGRTQMPLRAFFKAIDLVAAHEVASAGNRAPVAPSVQNLQFNAGATFAQCVACGGTQFRQVDPAQPLKYVSALLCRSCGAETTQAQLVMALAREVGQRARERVAAVRRGRAASRPRSSPAKLT